MRAGLWIFCLLAPAWAEANPSIVGHWFYYKKVYDGHDMPEPPEATLRMHFEFSAKGTSALYWWHEGEGDHCRREGVYSLEAEILRELVVWVDPRNSPQCASDPDMQLGRNTKTPYYFRGSDLALRFPLGDEELDLIWQKWEGK